MSNIAEVTNYPKGFDSGVLIKELLGVDAVPGNIFWVGNNSTLLLGENAASNNQDNGTFLEPFSTIDYAIGRCKANRNDVIFVRPGYSETISAASGITCDVAGVTIIGLGEGSDRPTITFGTATSASIVVSAANVTIKNIIGLAGIDALTQPFDIQAASCFLEIEWQDASSSVEAARAVLTTADADNIRIKLKYLGFTAGNACVNAVRLVGCDNGQVDIDFYGVASTAIVEFLTTACTNITISGYFYNSGTTDFSKAIVDTVTGSTWFVKGYDGAVGSSFSGGSGSALAGDDVSSISANVDTLILGTPQIVSKAYADLTGYDDAAAFTVTGDVKVRVYGVVGATAVQSTSGTTTLSVGTTENAGGIIAATTIDNSDFAATDVWVDTDPATDCETLASSWTIIGGGADINLVRSVDDLTQGALTLYCEWIPLSSGAALVAA